MNKRTKSSKSQTVQISGMQGGASPSPGMGVAQSLREGFPDLNLIGIDYSTRSLGIHVRELDEVRILPSWKYVNEELWVSDIATQDENTLWLPTLDLELRYAAPFELSPEKYLGPNIAALNLCAKPGVILSKNMPFNIPSFVKIAAKTEEECAEFCRFNDWDVFVKGPHYEAERVVNLESLRAARKSIEKKWQTRDLFIQKRIIGHERSVAFAAFRGELLGAVSLEKTEISVDGKTWGGRVEKLSADWEQKLRAKVRELNWTGGAEIEMIRDLNGEDWLIELNPRFPAWINGATLAGVNLPARLVARAFGREAPREFVRTEEFVRVTHEIPLRKSFSLTNYKTAGAGKRSASGKYTTAFEGLLDRLKNLPAPPSGIPVIHQSEVSEKPSAELLQIVEFAQKENTPRTYLMEEHAEQNFALLAKKCESKSNQDMKIKVGFSIKTSPEKTYLKWAKKYGFYAECISQHEASLARTHGFPLKNIILNGPGKFWPLNSHIAHGVDAIFADSVSELEYIVKCRIYPRTLGIRVRPAIFDSRFGIDLSNYETFQKVSRLLTELPSDIRIGIHFHLASSGYGIPFWFDCLNSVLGQAATLEKISGRSVATFDIGGGWLPKDFKDLNFETLRTLIKEKLPAVDQLILEPGKALTQDSVCLVTRVLDVRSEDDDKLDVVVDSSVNDFPVRMINAQKAYWWNQRTMELEPLKFGTGRILGRICMEDDILSSDLSLPPEMQRGDLIVFMDMGAYQRSMSYEFGIAKGKEFSTLDGATYLRDQPPQISVL